MVFYCTYIQCVGLVYLNLKVLEAPEPLLQGGTSVGLTTWGAPGCLVFHPPFCFSVVNKCILASQFAYLMFSNLKLEPDNLRFFF